MQSKVGDCEGGDDGDDDGEAKEEEKYVLFEDRRVCVVGAARIEVEVDADLRCVYHQDIESCVQ